MLKLAASNQFGIPNQTDLFFVDGNGVLKVGWVVGSGTWNGSTPISLPGVFPLGAQIAVSNQFGIPDQTDVFAVDVNGALNVAWVVGSGSWNGPTPISPPGLFPPGAGVAASNQFGIPNQTDVFVVDVNGALNVAWVVGSGPWNGPVPISPAGLFPPGAPVAASNQFGIPNQTDVFLVDVNGGLNVAWVVGSDAWNGPIPISPSGLFPLGGIVAASNQFGVPDQTDVFLIDIKGNLNVSWVVGSGAWNGPTSISLSGNFLPGASVAASNQFGIPNQTDVFLVDGNGTLNVAWVVGSNAWNGPVAISASGLFPPGAGVAASNQFGIPSQTDAFVDGNGTPYVAWVVGSGPWNGPIPLPS